MFTTEQNMNSNAGARDRQGQGIARCTTLVSGGPGLLVPGGRDF
jgi:hypothetical protein